MLKKLTVNTKRSPSYKDYGDTILILNSLN